MHWTDTAIILSARKHGESSAVLRILSREHGVFGGVIRAIHSKANRGIIQPGNIISATWNARLSEQLGSLKCELLQANTAHIMQDPARLAALTSACVLLESSLPERHPYPRLYDIAESLFHTLAGTASWQEDYVHFEMELLADTGFGMDLSSCAATETTENLIYVSPKSARAVCREAGEPYRDKLLPLPEFLLKSPINNATKPTEILAGLQLTGYFLAHWLLEPHHRKLPAARARLIQTLKEHHGAEV